MMIRHIMERGGEDLRDYKKNLKMAKRAIEALCELTDEREEEYGSDEEVEERRSRKRY